MVPWNKIVSFGAGVLTSSTTIFAIESMGHKIYPVPDEATRSREALRQFIRTLPLGALLTVEIAYVLGSVLGGFVIGKSATSHGKHLALGLGGLLTFFGAQNLIMIPHPLWFAVLTSVTYLPCAWLGSKLGGA